MGSINDASWENAMISCGREESPVALLSTFYVHVLQSRRAEEQRALFSGSNNRLSSSCRKGNMTSDYY